MSRYFIEIGRYAFRIVNKRVEQQNIDEVIWDILNICKNYFNDAQYILKQPIEKIGLVNHLAHHSYFKLVEQWEVDNLAKDDYSIKLRLYDDYFEIEVLDFNQSAFSPKFVYYSHKFERDNISLYEKVVDKLVELDK